MKKIYFIVIVTAVLSIQSFSQAYEGKTEYDKKKQDAFVIEYPYPPEAVETAFIERMKSLGYKGKEEKGLFNKDKGFRVFKNAYITDIVDTRMDYIVLIERKSRKEKDESVLYLVIQKDGANAVAEFNSVNIDNAKEFLNSLQPNIEDAFLEMQIKDQEDVVSKAEKKYKGLLDDQKSMENKIKKLEEDLETNEKDQEDTRRDIENQKKLLESLRLKRRS